MLYLLRTNDTLLARQEKDGPKQKKREQVVEGWSTYEVLLRYIRRDLNIPIWTIGAKP